MRLVGIPIPPSMNNAYPTGKNGRRYKSAELTRWQTEFQIWSFLNRMHVLELQSYFSRKGFLRVDCEFYFKHERVLCKDGRAKRLDADNRLKSLLDSLTNLIGIDDSWIWAGSFSKHVAKSHEECCVNLDWYTP